MIWGLWLLAAVAAILFALRVVFRPPDKGDMPSTKAIPMSDETKLGARVSVLMEANPGLNGVDDIADGREAFAARVVLARAAEASIDMQVFGWHPDTTGWVLLDELRRAAERGVRVRLLLDDAGQAMPDDVLAAFDALEHAKVRLFNPFMLRGMRKLSYLFDFGRLNRRMHNKSMTVDGAVTIVGGRNVADPYFSYGEGMHYFDFDIISAGEIASDVADAFDRYWSSASVYPASSVLKPSKGGLETLTRKAGDARDSAAGADYAKSIDGSRLVETILEDDAALDWVRVDLICDTPDKGQGKPPKDDLLLTKLLDMLEEPETSLDAVSAYFIPGRFGTELLTRLVKKGVDVRILTNSLVSTDVVPVHGAYARFRRRLMRGGVALHELCAEEGGVPKGGTGQDSAVSAALHAKTFAVDQDRIFTGSFNLDPRSALLNTEMGLLVRSPMIAKDLSRKLDDKTTTFRLSLNAGGGMVWETDDAEGEITQFTRDPHVGWRKRAMATLAGYLPVDRYL